MRKNECVLAEMVEKKSKYGNSYFEGQYESGGKIILRGISVDKEKKWQLLWIKDNKL